MLQAVEALKLILGLGDSLLGRLLHFDALKMKFREFKLRRDPECPVCGENPSIRELIDYEQFCGAVPAEQPQGDELSVEQLQHKRQAGESFFLLDVREPQEYEIARIEGSVLIPLRELPHRMTELDRDRDMVVYCHAGVRSAHAVQLLRNAGFDRATNLAGGIDAWSERIDPTVPRY
jgi:adenylyltransferase/sulfurtransferase